MGGVDWSQNLCEVLQVGLLGVYLDGSVWGLVACKINPSLSKTPQNYARNLKFGTSVHTNMQFQKICLLVSGHLLVLVMLAFFLKKQYFLEKIVLYSKQLYENCVGAFLVLFPIFITQEVTVNLESGFQIAPNCP